MRATALLLVVCWCGLAQSKFEVASVKPNREGPQGSFSIDTANGAHFRTRNFTPWNLIRQAYKLTDLQIVGAPEWIRNEGFDIDARPAAPVSPGELLVMLQGLLAERFRLEMHRESRSIPAYALQVWKGGPKLGAAAESESGSTLRMGDMTAKKMSMAGLAQILEFDLHRPVADQTGLKGDFSFQLRWTRESARTSPDAPDADPAKPSIFVALQEQLGLHLVTTKNPVEVYVVDRIERPTAN
jgi:uncharacterized protein (TIGR03435 family)